MLSPARSWAATYLLVLLLSPAAAFYPYIPKGWGDVTPETTSRSNALPSRTQSESAGFITVPLRRHPQPQSQPQSQPQRRDSIYNIVSATAPTQSNSVAIDQDSTDYTYMSVMSFGTSPTQFHMLLDTAAANTWVMSSACTTSICKNHNTLGVSESSSIKETDGTFSITYGTGNVNGSVAMDDAHFAGLTVPLTFGLANGVSQEFNSYALDGILGLGRKDTDPSGINSPSIIDVLHSQNLIDAKVFGVHLGRHASPPIDGELNLGAPNPSRYDGDLNYIAVVDNERGFWEIPLDEAGVDGGSSGLANRFAIIDTGTSFILLPPEDAAAMHALIPGAELNGDAYTVPCDTKAVVQLGFGGQVYNISSVDYVGGLSSTGACNSQIIARQTFGKQQWLVGDVFLKNVYTVFDYDQSRVGFGVKGGDTAANQDGGNQTDQNNNTDSSSATTAGTAPLIPTSTSAPDSASQANANSPAEPSSGAAIPAYHHRSGMLALGVALGALMVL